MPLYIAITGDGFVFDETRRGEDREAVSVTGDTSDKDDASAFRRPGGRAADLTTNR